MRLGPLVLAALIAVPAVPLARAAETGPPEARLLRFPDIHDDFGDPSLEKAVQLLLEELEKRPAPAARPTPPVMAR